MLWLILLIVIAIAVGILVIRSRTPYAVSPQQFEDTLVRVLEKRITAEEWDTFLHIPIGSDVALDLLRQRLLKLETQEHVAGAEEGALYHSTGMSEVAAVLAELRAKNA